MSDQTLQEWLEEVCSCHDVVPVRVTIGDQTFEGCRYKQNRAVSPGTRAYQEGKRGYVQEAIYLLGVHDPRWENGPRRKHKFYFTIEGDDRDWYVASHASEEVATDPRYAQFHFNGSAHFQLMPWTAGGKIDDFEPFDHVRLRAAIESVVTA